MREAIGGTWVTQLVIIFMLLFVGFLALTLNYTKAFKIKNEMLSIIEKQEGVTAGDGGTISIINGYLKANGYSAQKACPEGSYGVTDLNSLSLEYRTSGSKKYYYCVSKIEAPSTNHKDKSYYQVNSFFYFNLPLLGDVFVFSVNGSTSDIVNPQDKLKTTTEIVNGI